ncbi:MAG: 16S rRNA (guanine(966)-N(2))-methyltransferase RsmD [Rhodoferax sp.]
MPKTKTAHAQHAVRIIGGRYKRSKLPVADAPGLRPTPDRVRETLFNWLGQDLSGWHCLDAFAGTGALGFEAASRGAASVLLIESAPALAHSLRQTQVRLAIPNVQIQCGDALLALRRIPPASLDLIFIDPPFAAGLFQAALEAARPALKPNGCLYLEAPRAFGADALAALGWQLRRHARAGQVHAHLVQPRDPDRSSRGEPAGPGEHGCRGGD